LAAKRVKLSEIEQAYGRGAAAIYIAPFMYYTAQVCGLKELNDIQAKAIAGALYSALFFISVAELAVLIHRISMGEYGELYGQLTPQLIGSAARQYRTERMKLTAAIDAEQKALRANEMNGVMRALHAPDIPMQKRYVGIMRDAPDFVTDENGIKRESIFAELKRQHAADKARGKFSGHLGRVLGRDLNKNENDIQQPKD